MSKDTDDSQNAVEPPLDPETCQRLDTLLRMEAEGKLSYEEWDVVKAELEKR